jgi:hypothetical protein
MACLGDVTFAHNVPFVASVAMLLLPIATTQKSNQSLAILSLLSLLPLYAGV